jgi:LmbE family N-acetylglucosaminyl deacetylase
MKAEHSFFVDISDQWERKKKSVAAYQSQFNGSKFANQIYKPGVDIFELMETYQRQYGFEVGCTFAEAFWMAEPIRLDDPTTQPVRSI